VNAGYNEDFTYYLHASLYLGLTSMYKFRAGQFLDYRKCATWKGFLFHLVLFCIGTLWYEIERDDRITLAYAWDLLCFRSFSSVVFVLVHEGICDLRDMKKTMKKESATATDDSFFEQLTDILFALSYFLKLIQDRINSISTTSRRYAGDAGERLFNLSLGDAGRLRQLNLFCTYYGNLCLEGQSFESKMERRELVRHVVDRLLSDVRFRKPGVHYYK
jgi:hypothetical protein